MRARLTLVDLAALLMVLVVVGGLFYVLWSGGWLEEPDPRTWPKIAWPDGGSR